MINLEFTFKFDNKGNLIDVYTPYLIIKNGHIISLDMELPGDCTIIAYVFNIDKETICPVKLTYTSTGVFKGVIKLPLDFVDKLKGKPYCFVKFVISHEGNVITTDSFKINVDIQTLKLNTIEQYTTQMADVIKEINQLRFLINGMKKKVPDSFDKYDTFPRAKGMTLTVIDDQGNLGFDYPFLNSITRINGVNGFNHEVTLGAEHIPYDDKNTTADAINTLQLILRDTVTAVEGLNKRVSALEEALANYINDDVL